MFSKSDMLSVAFSFNSYVKISSIASFFGKIFFLIDSLVNIEASKYTKKQTNKQKQQKVKRGKQRKT